MTTSSMPLFETYARVPLAFERGDGVWLYTGNGDAYLDMTAGIAVNSLGHAHPHLVAAIQAQSEKLWHVSNIFQIPGQEALGRRLCDATFAERVFFANSGAEAIECALKTARRYHYVNGDAARTGFITFEGAFHGRTLAAIAAGGQAKYLEGFGPPVDGFDQVPFEDLDAARAAINDETAAILVEPIQGEGGIKPASGTFLRGLRQLCDDHGLLLIFDEVQSGVGRTGQFFAYQSIGVVPDLLATAKGIGGGFPLGACLATAEAAKGMTPGTHATTFGGNPLAMAVANAVLDVVLEPGFLDDVKRKGLLIKQKAAAIVDSHPQVFELVRGEGLMIGIKCRVPAGDVITALRDCGLLAVPAGDNVVRFVPALTITEGEIDDAMRRLTAAAETIEEHLAADNTRSTAGERA